MNDQRRIVVVLGMHRSGTSAVARALPVVGVSLGSRLMPAMPGNNPKGFWEDLDFHAFNERLLGALGSDWRRVRPFDAADWQSPVVGALIEPAVNLIEEKFAQCAPGTPFGFKDPRTAITWPFWRKVLANCAVQPTIVLSLRNPLSVARSLERRDSMDRGQAYLLWLHHTVASFAAISPDMPWVVVDYDRLIEQPAREVERIGAAIGRPVDAEEFLSFRRDFLDDSLRHATEDMASMEGDPACPELVKAVFETGELLARGEALELSYVAARVATWTSKLDGIRGELDIIDRLGKTIEIRRLQMREKDAQLREIRAVLGQEIHEVERRAREFEGRAHREIVQWEARYREAVDVIEAMRRSRSWRLTAPVRAVSGGVRATAGTAPVRVASALGRGLRGELRKHGVRGVMGRLPYYYRQRSLVVGLLRSEAAQPVAEWSFRMTAPEVRLTQLHPDLTGAGPAIDASISVVIPTLNAGAEFGWLVRKLLGQKGVRELQIVIVDSGSTDGTPELAEAAGARVVRIAPEEFSHSGARNLGAENADGDFLLFMVQDAYPIGEHWLWGMLRFLLDHSADGVDAVSCAETSRADSDMLYDSMIDTHYRFLGCRDLDRIGRFAGEDHMSLRSQGQLSDVACLIRNSTFQRYRYRGDYAEDLDLGLRIVRDGKAVAMLASIKVIHSHNRSAHYYLKRSFVDVVFLVNMFDDFAIPRVASVPALLRGIGRVAAVLGGWMAAQRQQPEIGELGGTLQEWLRGWRHAWQREQSVADVDLGDDRLRTYLLHLIALGGSAGDHAIEDVIETGDARQFVDMFLDRVEHFGRFAKGAYGKLDAGLHAELCASIVKIFAATIGSALAFAYMQFKREGGESGAFLDAVFRDLKAGI